MAVSGDWISLGEMMQAQNPPPSETHVACFCRPAFTYCGRWTPGNNVIDVTTREAEIAAQRIWCAGCMTVFEGNGCGICGCRLGSLCETCDAALQQ